MNRKKNTNGIICLTQKHISAVRSLLLRSPPPPPPPTQPPIFSVFLIFDSRARNVRLTRLLNFTVSFNVPQTCTKIPSSVIIMQTFRIVVTEAVGHVRAQRPTCSSNGPNRAGGREVSGQLQRGPTEPGAGRFLDSYNGAQQSRGQGGFWTVTTGPNRAGGREVSGQLQRGPTEPGAGRFLDSYNGAQQSRGQGGLWTVTTGRNRARGREVYGQLQRGETEPGAGRFLDSYNGAQQSRGQGGLWTVTTGPNRARGREVYGQLQRGPTEPGAGRFMDSYNGGRTQPGAGRFLDSYNGAQQSRGQGGVWTVITRHADDWQRRVYGQLQQGSRGPLMTGKDEFMDSKNKAVACRCMLS